MKIKEYNPKQAKIDAKLAKAVDKLSNSISDELKKYISDPKNKQDVKLAEKLFKGIQKFDFYAKEHIVRKIDEIIKQYKNISNVDANTLSAVNERIDNFKRAVVTKFGGVEGNNWKSLVIGASSKDFPLEEKIKASAIYDLDLGAKTDPIINSEARFKEFAVSDGFAVAGSSYAGPQHLPKKDQHTEDSVLMQTMNLPDGSKVTFLGVADGLSGHTDAIEGIMAARSGQFALKHAFRLMSAQLRQNASPEELKENMNKIFERVVAETKLKQSPNSSNYTRANTTLLASALIEKGNERKLVFINFGDCLLAKYDMDRGFVDTIAGAIHKGPGPAGIPYQYNNTDLPYVGVADLRKGEIPLLMTDGIWEGLPHEYILTAPASYIKEVEAINEERMKKDGRPINIAGTAIEGGVRIQCPKEQGEEIIKHKDFDYTSERIIVLNSKAVEEIIKAKKNELPNAPFQAADVAKLLLAYSVASAEKARQNTLDNPRGIGDDATILAMSPALGRKVG